MKPRPQNFGPWTTSLDAGSRLYLSTFWKQRLQRLAGLTSARMSRRTLSAAILIAAVVGISPLVELVPAAPANAELKAETKAKTETKAKAPAGDFVATFSNGVTVELIGLGQNPSAKGDWWKPDGTPLEKRPYHRVMALMGSPGSLAREVCWQWRGVEGEIKTDWGTVPAYGSAGGGHTSVKNEKGQPIKGITARAIGLQGSLDTFTVKLSMTVPSTPWQTVDESQAGHARSTGGLLPDGKILSLSYMRPRTEGDDTIVVVGYKVSGDIRVIAIDKERKLHIGEIPRGGTSSNGFAMREVHFANVKPEDLKTWRFQVRLRKTETVEFRNVSLHAGKVTDVETVFTTPVEPVRATAEADSPVEFGEVFEVAIETVNQNSNNNFGIDFETGNILTFPEKLMGSDIKGRAWIAKKKIDAMILADIDSTELLGFNMASFPANPQDWNPKRAVLLQVDSIKPSPIALISGAGPLPATHIFKTREGTRGVLQILEFEDGKAVKLRYKLQKPE